MRKILFFAVLVIALLNSVSAQTAANSRLKMTLAGEKVVYADFEATVATAEFITKLPFTVTMHEHLNRQKEVYLPFSLSVANQKNKVNEYKVGDIVYWHPGPTMGIFTSHDGRSISSGIEVLARMDAKGVADFLTYKNKDVSVKFDLEPKTTAVNQSQNKRQLVITLNDKEVIYADVSNTSAANAFVQHLPLTLDMTDYLKREKHAGVNFTIAQSELKNIQYPYEIGDIIYYPPGPTFAMYYAHDGRTIAAGMEVIAKLNKEGMAKLATYSGTVKVNVALRTN